VKHYVFSRNSLKVKFGRPQMTIC